MASFRADGNDATGLNARQGFWCERDGDGNAINGVIYLGLPLANAGDTFWQEFDTWAQNLHTLGYTGTRGLLPFLSQPGRLQNGELDPSDPGFWQPPRRGNSPGGQAEDFNFYNPYSVSFTIYPGGGFNIHPPFPPGQPG